MNRRNRFDVGKILVALTAAFVPVLLGCGAYAATVDEVFEKRINGIMEEYLNKELRKKEVTKADYQEAVRKVKPYIKDFDIEISVTRYDGTQEDEEGETIFDDEITEIFEEDGSIELHKGDALCVNLIRYTKRGEEGFFSVGVCG